MDCWTWFHPDRWFYKQHAIFSHPIRHLTSKQGLGWGWRDYLKHRWALEAKYEACLCIPAAQAPLSTYVFFLSFKVHIHSLHMSIRYPPSKDWKSMLIKNAKMSFAQIQVPPKTLQWRPPCSCLLGSTDWRADAKQASSADPFFQVSCGHGWNVLLKFTLW